MSDTVIQVEGLSKKYRIQHQAEKQRYSTLRDELTNRFQNLFKRKLKDNSKSTAEDFWALRDVSFEIKQGEVVGLIGRNGAGKSTLLKILSRITEPSRGRVRLKGRIASLLEVGTGFHPELTGRENIYLNGAILGMSRVEIKRKFDEIVAFAEVEKFLDTPVKRYSSGMYVRLAFAVAAHLEPEILIVDEVLAVGDTQFQNKCMGKIKDVASGGRTVLFVSHNLAAITSLCNRGIVLKSGQIQANTTTEEAVDAYMRLSLDFVSEKPNVLFVGNPKNNNEYYVSKIEIMDEKGDPKLIVRSFDYVKFRIWFNVPVLLPQGSVLMKFTSMQGILIAKLETNPQEVKPLDINKGLTFVDCIIPSLPLMEGNYNIEVGLAIYAVQALQYLNNAGILLVSPLGPGRVQELLRDTGGILAMEHHWSTKDVS